jgi:hypothetical protein
MALPRGIVANPAALSDGSVFPLDCDIIEVRHDIASAVEFYTLVEALLMDGFVIRACELSWKPRNEPRE